jgi:antitoxin component of MazEF toxin-antitoxin module
MRTKIRKSGKGASLRRPAEIAEAARDAYDVEALIAGITPENRHGEVDFGPAVGQERQTSGHQTASAQPHSPSRRRP